VRIHHLYADEEGVSHFADLEVEWETEQGPSKRSAWQSATGILFRQTSGEYDLDWHPAPRRQYVVNLDAGVRITAGDGEVREIGPGEVLLAEDLTGKGHLSQAIAGAMRHSLFVSLD
jgi:hypothetical protein